MIPQTDHIEYGDVLGKVGCILVGLGILGFVIPLISIPINEILV